MMGIVYWAAAGFSIKRIRLHTHYLACFVFPAKAGIQYQNNSITNSSAPSSLDPRLRGDGTPNFNEIDI